AGHWLFDLQQEKARTIAYGSRPARSHLGFFLLSRVVLRARATHFADKSSRETGGFCVYNAFSRSGATRFLPASVARPGALPSPVAAGPVGQHTRPLIPCLSRYPRHPCSFVFH